MTATTDKSISLTGKHISYWIDSTLPTDYPALPENLTVDVAIIGAGIVGITAATLLKKAGKTVALIDSQKIAQGTSGKTTAKITALHRLIYDDLIKDFDIETARIYGEANQAAIAQVAKLVAEEQIDCDFKWCDAYTFARYTEDVDKIHAEVQAAQKANLPASFVTDVDLPFAIAGAIKLPEQARFHVRKYLLNLANKIVGEGSYVFENTRVQEVNHSEPCEVVSDRGKIIAQDVIVATNLPILDPGLFFAKAYPKRSYLVGARIDSSQAPEAMYIGAGKDDHSIRCTPLDDGSTLLIVGGQGHKVGETENTQECYRKLENYVRSEFKIETIDYRWSSQDMVSMDKLPYIGKLTPTSDHIYVATGFSLWGMSKGTMSAMVLADIILGKANPWAKTFDSTRATPFISKSSIKENLDVATHWFGDRLKGLTDNSFDKVNINEGKILTIGIQKVAAYRDETNQVHAVSAVCPHLGCVVNWNNGEKSWDCPCHGSRFSCDGELLRGPAVKDLQVYDT
ncbi:MAG: FAD-dependent oxidoreductase [Jaaginema sp. PMC 1079.18]|nr:FAD-dependent oxidoreductase [Jaaginema sp. PMC 1080.18]MEC4849674.1 FAD-dependent oxidoreductase [Jaaginema sp. PMC 1079.18]MEC4866157.1 FAD-dependent oxidoreductase [Jaaginema sp. PMC 1078.18]